MSKIVITILDFIEPDEAGFIFDGLLDLNETINPFEEPQDLIHSVLKLNN